MSTRQYYAEVSLAIESYERYHHYHRYTIDWICRRIEWCWKWKKITTEQKDELCDRIIEVMNNWEGD